MKRFTLGMCVHDDFDGVYFSAQANRMMHPLLDAEGELLVVDNNPTSRFGKEVKRFCEETGFIRYEPCTKTRGTAVRNEIFNLAHSEIVICIDSHVLLSDGAIEAVVDFFEEQSGSSRVLLHGPQITDSLTRENRSFRDIWAHGLWGKWDHRRDIRLEEVLPYEVTFCGLGAFAARKSEWPGFHPLFRGFGGEEGYIQELYRRGGGVVLGLPKFRWLHRYGRPGGVSYRMCYSDRVYNYFVGAIELKQNVDRIVEYYSPILGVRIVESLFDLACSDIARISRERVLPA